MRHRTGSTSACWRKISMTRSSRIAQITRVLAPICTLLLLSTALCGASETVDLGRLDFPNSGAPEAQKAFTRGVLLLHSFEFEDARGAFEEARAIDSDFAMAYWGEAMTHNQPLWRRQNREAALGVLALYAASPEERAAKVPTERERGYLEAVDELFSPSGDKPSRDRAYSEAMGKLSGRYPMDLEAKAFYALSILGTSQGERDFRVYMRAAAVAEEVFAANPRHPGAAHYLIHSYDDPVHAPLGLRAARVYADIAPAASHAQHMVSHIFVALGRWEDSVQSNINAYEVSKKRRESQDAPPDAINYHALQWLQYSYLQLGLLEDARDILDKMAGLARESQSDRALWYYATMRGMWGVEAPDEDIPAPLDYEILDSEGVTQDLFASGYRALRAGEAETAQEHLAEIRERLQAHRAKLSEGESLSDGSGGQTALKKATVLERSLAALVALDDGKESEALALLDEATDLESSLPLEFGPPDIIKPSHELYGEVLLGLGRPEEAARMFKAALDRAPRRTASLFGLAQAARRFASPGSEASLASACAELAVNTARGALAERTRKLCAG